MEPLLLLVVLKLCVDGCLFHPVLRRFSFVSELVRLPDKRSDRSGSLFIDKVDRVNG